MSVTGIICEYNPFHEGHKYHIQKARERTGASAVVVVMNGDFVQRGAPAIIDKYTRARMALSEGADLVFELPVRYGLSSAEDFAYGGILALESLGFVDSYCFGCESGDVEALGCAAGVLAEESDVFRRSLSAALRSGKSYPAAREQALREQMESEGTWDKMPDLTAPNNILGLEYIRAAIDLHSSMVPVAVKRQGMGYHEREDAEGSGFLSATAVRERIRKGNFDGIPEKAERILRQADIYLGAEDFWMACSYAIRSRWENLEDIKDISAELAARFRKCWYEAVSFDDFVNRCKTKNITMSRIRRCVFQTLVGIEKCKKREKVLPYIRLLGMRQGAAKHLKLPGDTVVVGRLAKDKKKLGRDAREKLEQDILASDLYRNAYLSRGGQVMPEEYRHSVMIVDDGDEPI